MSYPWKPMIFLALMALICPATASAQEKLVVGVIPKAQKPLKTDGKRRFHGPAKTTSIIVVGCSSAT